MKLSRRGFHAHRTTESHSSEGLPGPEYLIDETHLTFELYEDRTLVHAQLVMRRNPERPAGKLPPLELHGQQLELLSIALNDRALSRATISSAKTA